MPATKQSPPETSLTRVLRPAGVPSPARLLVRNPTVTGDIAAFMLANWKVLLLSSVLGLLAAYIFNGTQVPQYRASATIEIQDLNDNFLNREVSQVTPFANASVANDMQTQLRLLQSRTLIARTVEAIREEKLPPPRGINVWLAKYFSSPVERSPADLFESAARALQVRETRQSRIVDISFESPDAAYAATFANALAHLFIEQSVESRLQISRRTSEFLEKQLADAGAKMSEAENKLQSYARQSGLLVTTEEHRPDEERFRQIQESLSKAQENRMIRQARLETAANAPIDSLDVPLGSALKEFQTKLAELRRQRADLITVYTENFDGVRRLDAQIDRLEAEQRKESTAILQAIKNDYNDAVSRERLLQTSYQEQFSRVTQQAGIAIQYGILKRAVDTHREVYNNLLQRTAEAKVASALRASGARLVDPASTPRLPFKPSRLLNLLWGASAGLLLGLVLAAAGRAAGSGMHAYQEMASQMGVPDLGSIPKISSHAAAKAMKLWGTEAGFIQLPAPAADSRQRVATTAWTNRFALPANSFRSVLASILLSRQAPQAPKVIVVSSVHPREGKTTLVSNLAAVLAHMGRKVLLVDASPDRALHQILQVSSNASLQDVLDLPGNNSALLHFVTSNTILDGVAIVDLGGEKATALDILYAPGLDPILAEMRQSYDIVLIDAPCLNQMPDARIFGRVADGIVLVVHENEANLQAALLTADRLRQDGAIILGTVMNQSVAHNPASAKQALGKAF